MAESDRQRLLGRALALPHASEADFFGTRRPPADAAPEHVRVIKDTGLRTRLIEAGLAEGLQSPKGPQKIASILRIYPNFDAPPKNGARKNPPRVAKAAPAAKRILPTVEEMEALLARLRQLEREIVHEVSIELDERIERLKHAIAAQHGEALEATHRELGVALDQRRALTSHVRAEAFRRLESQSDFAPRAFLRLLAR
jgi:hypothetical protein